MSRLKSARIDVIWSSVTFINTESIRPKLVFIRVGKLFSGRQIIQPVQAFGPRVILFLGHRLERLLASFGFGDIGTVRINLLFDRVVVQAGTVRLVERLGVLATSSACIELVAELVEATVGRPLSQGRTLVLRRAPDVDRWLRDTTRAWCSSSARYVCCRGPAHRLEAGRSVEPPCQECHRAA